MSFFGYLHFCWNKQRIQQKVHNWMIAQLEMQQKQNSHKMQTSVSTAWAYPLSSGHPHQAAWKQELHSSHLLGLHKCLAWTQRAKTHGSFPFLGIGHLNAGCPVPFCHLQLILKVPYGTLCQQIHKTGL